MKKNLLFLFLLFLQGVILAQKEMPRHENNSKSVAAHHDKKNVVNKIKNKDSEVIALLKNFKTEDINNAVPYSSNGKWGWLHRKTMQPLSQPLFDYTDFKTNKGLLFVYKGKKRYFKGINASMNNSASPNQEPLTIEEFGQDDAPDMVGIMQGRGQEEVITKPTTGFIVKNGKIQSFANQYQQVNLISEVDNPRWRMAIATKSDKKKGIIYEEF